MWTSCATYETTKMTPPVGPLGWAMSYLGAGQSAHITPVFVDHYLKCLINEYCGGVKCFGPTHNIQFDVTSNWIFSLSFSSRNGPRTELTAWKLDGPAPNYVAHLFCYEQIHKNSSKLGNRVQNHNSKASLHSPINEYYDPFFKWFSGWKWIYIRFRLDVTYP